MTGPRCCCINCTHLYAPTTNQTLPYILLQCTNVRMAITQRPGHACQRWTNDLCPDMCPQMRGLCARASQQVDRSNA